MVLDNLKELSRKYTQEYGLDEPTRLRAEDLYKEFYSRNISKDPSVSIPRIGCIMKCGKTVKVSLYSF
jgi:hypothetical protein